MTTGDLTAKQKEEKAAPKQEEEAAAALRKAGEAEYGPQAPVEAIPEAGDIAKSTVVDMPEIGNKSGEELLGAMIAWLMQMLLALFAEGANKARRELAIRDFKNMAPQLKAMSTLQNDRNALIKELGDYKAKNPNPTTTQQAEIEKKQAKIDGMKYGLDAYQKHLQNVSIAKFANHKKIEDKATEIITNAQKLISQAQTQLTAAGTDKKAAEEASKIIQQQQAIIEKAQTELIKVRESKAKLEGQTAQIDGKAQGISLGDVEKDKTEIKKVAKDTEKEFKIIANPIDSIKEAIEAQAKKRTHGKVTPEQMSASDKERKSILAGLEKFKDLQPKEQEKKAIKYLDNLVVFLAGKDTFVNRDVSSMIVKGLAQYNADKNLALSTPQVTPPPKRVEPPPSTPPPQTSVPGMDTLFVTTPPPTFTPGLGRSTDRPSSVINTSQMTIKDLKTELDDMKQKGRLKDYGIHSFEEVPQAGLPSLKINMFCTPDQKKTTEVKAEQKLGTPGVTYSMQNNLTLEERKQTIDQIVKFVVETAKPGTTFQIPDNANKEIVQAALDKYLKVKLGDYYVNGQNKVPDAPKPHQILSHGG